MKHLYNCGGEAFTDKKPLRSKMTPMTQSHFKYHNLLSIQHDSYILSLSIFHHE